jgi:putative ABC transport system substrate-binding protein
LAAFSFESSDEGLTGRCGVLADRCQRALRATHRLFQQATQVELIINLKTAEALGLTVPMSLLGRADEVID